MQKGLASFEFLITLSLILMMTTVLISDSVTQSRETMVQTTARSTITSKLTLKEIQDTSCIDPVINKYQVNNETIEIDIEPNSCIITGPEIADVIESEVCGAQPNQDNYATCSGKTYEVKVE